MQACTCMYIIEREQQSEIRMPSQAECAEADKIAILRDNSARLIGLQGFDTTGSHTWRGAAERHDL